MISGSFFYKNSLVWLNVVKKGWIGIKVCIQKVNDLDIEEMQPLVDESVDEGFRHLKRLADEYESGINRFDQAGEALFIAKHSNRIIGICGLNQDPFSKERLGRVRRLYVSIHYRRQGIAKLLMAHVIKEAKRHYQTIVLKTDSPAASQLYVSLGFSIKTEDSQATHFLNF